LDIDRSPNPEIWYHPAMISDIRSAELVRDALARLYDPHALAAAPLTSEFMQRGLIRSPNGLFDRLIGTIERMKPPDSAPPTSQGWCYYHYLQRRYVDCCSHASIALELGISVRQASRIRHFALSAAAGILLGGDSPGIVYRPNVPVSAQGDIQARRRPHPRMPIPDMSLTSELSLISGQQTEEPIVVADVVASVFETLGGMANARGVELRAAVSDLVPSVRLSRVILRQMILNAAVYLMGLFLDDGRSSRVSTLSVSVRASPSGDTVTITLEREGRPKTDEPAHGDTLDSLLAAVKHLARQQKCVVDEAPSSDGRVSLRLVVPTGARTQSVLLLDDNPDIGELLQRMLSGSVYNITHVRTASRAVAIARETQPSVILLDVVLPVQDGWEVLATLRADPLTTSIPIIVCSVLPDRELALSLGAVDFLAKPIARTTLVQALSRIESTSVMGARVTARK
jgi:CheY-like chemotaxis protein